MDFSNDTLQLNNSIHAMAETLEANALYANQQDFKVELNSKMLQLITRIDRLIELFDAIYQNRIPNNVINDYARIMRALLQLFRAGLVVDIEELEKTLNVIEDCIRCNTY